MIQDGLQARVQIRRALAYLRVTGGAGAIPVEPDRFVEGILSTRSRLGVVDFCEATSLDSRGIEWLEQTVALAEAKGVNVRVVAPKGSRPRRVLELMRLDRVVRLFDTILSACRRRPKQ